MQYPPDQPYPGQQPPQQPNTFYPSQHPTFPQQQPYYPPYGAPLPPQQPYPPQYPPQPGYPPPQPPKKNKTGLWVSVGIAVLVIFACIASGSHGSSSPDTTVASTSNTTNATAAPQPTQAPTATPKPQVWTTLQTFKGNGEQKTAVFTVPDTWAIVWACNPSSFDGMNYNVIVSVYNSDGTPADYGAINSMCKPGTIKGYTQEHQGGNIYLDISSEGDWAVQVEVLK